MPKGRRVVEVDSMKKKLERRKKIQADNRRNLLSKLSPAARDMAVQEFAKLGLFQ